MPVNPNKGESRDEFISRCIIKEMDSGKPQDQSVAICISIAEQEFKSATQSVSDATWSTSAPISVNFESYNDYPEAAKNAAKRALEWVDKNGWGDCGTAVGKIRANQLANGENISRDTIARMAGFARHEQNSDVPYSEGCGGLMWDAWGGKAGIEWAQRKLKEIDKVENLSKHKKVIFNEDFDEEKLLDFKERGYKVYIRSARKIKRKDGKVWNKLKRAGLSEDNLVFGELKDLDKRYNFDLFMTGEDPILEALSVKGQVHNPKKILHEEAVFSLEDAELKMQSAIKNIDLKFVKVVSKYKYELTPGIPELVEGSKGSREFCKRMMDSNKYYTLEEIKSLSNRHLEEMFSKYGIEPDTFLYRGGWYRYPGTQQSQPFCRHQWTLKIFIE